jgi:hypothetical protein
MLSGDRVCVLDLETRMSLEARAFLPRGESPKAMRDALVEISSASMLEFKMGSMVGDFALSTFSSDELGEDVVLRRIEKALDRAKDGWLVTHNGIAWDIPICARRAMHHWLHDARSIHSWWCKPSDRHIETMVAFGRGRDRGPSLVDLAAGLGYSAVPVRASLLRPVATMISKGQVDIVATTIGFLHLMAFERGSAKWLAEAWRELGRYLITPGIRSPHLMPIASLGIGLADACGN